MRSIGRTLPLTLACLLVAGAAVPAEAQLRMGIPDEFDRVRLTALGWLGRLDGGLRIPDIDAVEPEIDIRDQLGIAETEAGWLVEGNVAAARRHRFVLAASARETTGRATLDVEVRAGGARVPVRVPVETVVSLAEVRGTYNFLVVATRPAEVGLLAGVGYFDLDARLRSDVGGVGEALAAPYPNLGANALLNPAGRVRAYVEVAGFPRVTVDDLSGRLVDFHARLELFVVDNFGVILGFRSYAIDFDEQSGVRFDLTWRGVTVGGQLRF